MPSYGDLKQQIVTALNRDDLVDEFVNVFDGFGWGQRDRVKPGKLQTNRAVLAVPR